MAYASPAHAAVASMNQPQQTGPIAPPPFQRPRRSPDQFDSFGGSPPIQDDYMRPRMGGGDPREGWSGPSTSAFRGPGPMSSGAIQAMGDAYGRGGDSRPQSRASRFWQMAQQYGPQGGMAGMGINAARQQFDPSAEAIARDQERRQMARRGGGGMGGHMRGGGGGGGRGMGGMGGGGGMLSRIAQMQQGRNGGGGGGAAGFAMKYLMGA